MASRSGSRSGTGGGKPGSDRTKHQATPARSGQAKPKESWWSIGCGFLLGGFMWLFLTGAGVALLVYGAHDLPWQLGDGTSSVLHMTVDQCDQVGHGKYPRYDCLGHGDPGRTGVVNEEWLMAGVGHAYTPGKVLDVRCSRTGGCQETGTSQVAADIASVSFGLLLSGGGLSLLALGIRSRLGRGRPSRRTRRTGGVVAAALGVVGLAAVIVAAAT